MKVSKRNNIFKVILVVVILMALLWNLKIAPGLPDISNEQPVHSVDAQKLIALINDEQQKLIKAEDVLEIEGVIKEINYKNGRATILLEAGIDTSSLVICDMQDDQLEKIEKLQPKDTIKLKGIFKGFLKDAIFLNCVISE